MTPTGRPHDGVISYLEHARQCAESRSRHPSADPSDALAERAWADELAAAIDWIKLAPRWSLAIPEPTDDLFAAIKADAAEIFGSATDAPNTQRPKLTLIRGDHP